MNGCNHCPSHPNPQQPFHLFSALAGHLFISGGIVQGQAVAAFLHAVYRFLAGGVEALFQGVLGHGRDDDHGDVLHVAGLHDLPHVDVKEVAVGLTAEVVEYQQVVAADVVQVLLPVLPVQGEQVFYDFHETGQQAAVAFVAQGVDDLDGGVGLAGAFGAEQEQAVTVCFHFLKVVHEVFEVPCGFGAAAVVTGKGPLVHVGVRQGMLPAGFCLFQFFPLQPFCFDPCQAVSFALAVDGEGPQLALPHVQHLFGAVAVAAVDDAVFFVVAFMVASFKGFFGDQAVAVLLPVVVGAAGGVVRFGGVGCCCFRGLFV